MNNTKQDFAIQDEKLNILAKKVCIGFVAALTLRIIVHVGMAIASSK